MLLLKKLYIILLDRFQREGARLAAVRRTPAPEAPALSGHVFEPNGVAPLAPH
jgi:hypothetical protein